MIETGCERGKVRTASTTFPVQRPSPLLSAGREEVSRGAQGLGTAVLVATAAGCFEEMSMVGSGVDDVRQTADFLGELLTAVESGIHTADVGNGLIRDAAAVSAEHPYLPRACQ